MDGLGRSSRQAGDHHLASSEATGWAKSKLRSAITALTVTIWFAFLVRAILTFRPQSSLLPLYNSDDAIPLLMSNFRGFNPFCLFFWGNDRFGAWPFNLLQLIHFVFGLDWSALGLAAALVLFVFLGAWPIYDLSGKRIWVVPAYLALIILQPVIRLHLLHRHVFAWQIPAILFSWYSLRKLAETHSPRAHHFAIAGLLCLLAVWSSPLSGPLLLALGLIEWIFWRLRSPEPPPKSALGSGLLRMCLPAIVGIAGERVLHSWFHAYAIRKFHGHYRTSVDLDLGHLADNARAFTARLFANSFWVLSAIGLAVAIFVVYEWARSWHEQSKGVVKAREHWEPLVVGCIALALLALIIPIFIVHVRENAYSERYLTPVHFFGNSGGVAAVALVLHRWWRARRAAFPLLGGVATGFTALALWLLFPVSRPNPQYSDLQAASAWLGAQPGEHVLLGGYWGTYVFAALNIPAGIIPTPAQGDYDRTPWTMASIRAANEIFVSMYNYQGFGSASDPEPWLLEGDSVLRRVENSRWSLNDIVFWRYRNETAKMVELTASSPIEKWNACEAGGAFSVAFEPVAAGHLLLWAEHDAQVPTVRVVAIDGDGTEQALVPLRQGGRLREYALGSREGAVSRIALRAAVKSGNCKIAALAVVREG